MARWTAQQKATALEIAERETVVSASEATGIPEGTIHYWRSLAAKEAEPQPTPADAEQAADRLQQAQAEAQEWKNRAQAHESHLTELREQLAKADQRARKLTLRHLMGEDVKRALEEAKADLLAVPPMSSWPNPRLMISKPRRRRRPMR